MCPICMGAAAIALAGTGSSGGLATLVAAKLHHRRRAGVANGAIKPMSKIDLQPKKAGGKP